MDSKQIKSIDEQVKTLIDNIKKLQEEIKNYQNGYRAFEDATKSLNNLAESQSELTGAIKTSVENLEKIDSIAVLNKVEETAHELTKMSEELDSLFDKLAVVAKSLSDGVENMNKQVKLTEEANVKMFNDADKKIKDLFASAEENMVKMMKEAGEKYAKLMAATEQKLIDASEKNIQDIKRVTSEISSEVKTISENADVINAKLDEGVKVKKRFF